MLLSCLVTLLAAAVTELPISLCALIVIAESIGIVSNVIIAMAITIVFVILSPYTVDDLSVSFFVDMF